MSLLKNRRRELLFVDDVSIVTAIIAISNNKDNKVNKIVEMNFATIKEKNKYYDLFSGIEMEKPAVDNMVKFNFNHPYIIEEKKLSDYLKNKKYVDDQEVFYLVSAMNAERMVDNSKNVKIDS